MKTLIYNPAQIVTVNTNGKNFKRGNELNDVNVITDYSIVLENDLIKDLIKTNTVDKRKFGNTIDASNNIVLPGIVECHTHTVFAGSRANEFKEKIAGVSYEDIAKKGGGINSSVQSVRNSTFDELVNIVKPRIENFIAQGVTTLEIKSGYGLSFYDEIKILQVIKHLNNIYEIDLIPTFLGAHTFPPEYKNDNNQYIKIIIDELLPYIAKNKLAVFCDGFCESTAFSSKQIKSIFEKASQMGFKLKLHTEQFNNIGGLKTAIEMNATSADHLEVIAEDDIFYAAESETVLVLLPGVSYFLNYDFAPARKLIDANGIVALATDYNPGSSHISSISMIMNLAAIKMRMSIEEIIAAYTINSAKALEIHKSVGSIEINKKADLAIFDTIEYSDIVYNVANNLNCMTIKNGKVVFEKN